jgi:hypothetical protein
MYVGAGLDPAMGDLKEPVSEMASNKFAKWRQIR